MRILKVKDWLRLHKEIEKMKLMESTMEALKAQRDSIEREWEKSDLLAGLKGVVKSNIAKMLESQASQIVHKLDIEPSAFKTKEQ